MLTRNQRTPSLPRLLRALASLCALAAISAFGLSASPARAQGSNAPFPVLDPQKVLDQDDMTWNDYHPIPGINWADPSRQASERVIHIALVLADFDDQPFVITLPKKSDIFGNPQIDPIKREDVAKWYADFWNKPQAINHGHTVNEYWMEVSHGRYGVQFDAYGPYHMDHKMIEYSDTVNRGGGDQTTGVGRLRGAGDATGTSGTQARGARNNVGSLAQELDRKWRADAGDKVYQLVLRDFAGYDETCVWQEFGEMKFQTKEDITPEFGSPLPGGPLWMPTRYTDWTSWRAGSFLWSNSAIINGESSGSIRHEISHAAFQIGDNNNNPYVKPYHRAGSGPWDIMDRGSFNGPGGPHNRWEIPVVAGGSMPAGVMMSQQIKFGFVSMPNVLRLNRENLAKSGPAVINVIPREVEPKPTDFAGLTITLGEGGQADKTPIGDGSTDPLYGGSYYDYYSLEVVNQIGYDSFTPDGGVLIAKNTGTPAPRSNVPGGGGAGGERRGGAARGADGATSAAQAGGAGARGGRGGRGGRGRGAGAIAPAGDAATSPTQRGGRRGGGGRGAGSLGQGVGGSYFNWTIDANPQDINKLDFKRPHGEPVMRTIADYRQLNDALFHAGTNSGSQYEYEDAANRLHFYVINMQKDANGLKSYTVGVRSLDGAGPQSRGVALATPSEVSGNAVTFTLKNTGAAVQTDPALHLQDSNASLTSDIYRLKVEARGDGWKVNLPNSLAAVKFGESVPVTVNVAKGSGSAPTTIVLTATSESDPTKTTQATYELK